MARNSKEITIEQAKALATRWKAQYEEHLRTAAIASRFADATPSEVIHMWETGRKERGQKLSKGEFAALVERWLELFGAYPPSADDNGNDNAPGDTASEPEVSRPEDDTMLSPRDVERVTGLSKSTIKRRVADGTFPKPMHLSPRRRGWPAREVKDWLNRLDDRRRATRQ